MLTSVQFRDNFPMLADTVQLANCTQGALLIILVGWHQFNAIRGCLSVDAKLDLSRLSRALACSASATAEQSSFPVAVSPDHGGDQDIFVGIPGKAVRWLGTQVSGGRCGAVSAVQM